MRLLQIMLLVSLISGFCSTHASENADKENRQDKHIVILESPYKDYLLDDKEALLDKYVKAAEELQLKPGTSTEIMLLLLPIYNKKYGSKSKKVIELSLALGSQESLSEKQRNHHLWVAVSKAKVFKKIEPDYEAYIQLNVASHLAGSIGNDFKKYFKMVEETHSFYTINRPSHSVERLKANLNYGITKLQEGLYYKHFKKNNNAAQKKFLQSVDIFESNLATFDLAHTSSTPISKLELETRSSLIYVLESMGRSGEATKHCRVIGEMTPWQDFQEQKPLFRIEPIYPRRAAKRGRSGMVKLEFTVTENGYADGIIVLKSKGGVSFEKNAIQAVKKWRYAPKFENGQAVAAKTHIYLDFDIVK